MTLPLPRPVLIALVGAVAGVGLLMLTRGGGEQTGADAGPVPAPSTSTPAPSANPGSEASKPGGTQGEETGSGAAAAPKGGADPDVSKGGGKSTQLPADVSRALDARKVVVLLFWNPRGTDDRDVKQAVDSLPRRGGKVAVFEDKLSNLSRYASITTATNVTQTPTLVVVDPGERARVATGFLDETTVEQYVVDALRRR